jgi:hypothetical protein
MGEELGDIFAAEKVACVDERGEAEGKKVGVGGEDMGVDVATDFGWKTQ